MRETFLPLIAFAAAILFASCGKKSPEDQAGAEIIDIFEELSGAIESIDDAESAKAASSKFSELAEEFQTIQARTAEFTGAPSASMQRKMKAAQTNLNETMRDMQEKFKKDPALALEALPALLELGQKMQQAGRQMQEANR